MSTFDDQLRVASLLCSRLSHDAIGSVSAIYNGVEILAAEKDGAVRSKALELIEFSACEARRRVQFFRVA